MSERHEPKIPKWWLALTTPEDDWEVDDLEEMKELIAERPPLKELEHVAISAFISGFFQACGELGYIERVKELTDGKGVERIFVATGNLEANQLAVGIGGARSVTVFFGGAAYEPTHAVSIPLWDSTLGEKEYVFSWLSPYTFPEALHAIEAGLVDVKPLLTHSFGIEEAGRAIETAEKRLENALKVQIKIS